MAGLHNAPKFYRRLWFTKPERRAAKQEVRRLVRAEQDPDDTPTPIRTNRNRATYDYW